MSKRIPYEQVAVQMDRLWNMKIDPTDEAAMEKHCDLLRGYVEGCGWTVDDYVIRMMNYSSEKN